MAEKICDNCDAKVADTDETCPKCGVNFKDLDDEIAVVERAQAAADRRKKRNAPPEPIPAPVKKKSVFSSLGKAVK